MAEFRALFPRIHSIYTPMQHTNHSIRR